MNTLLGGPLAQAIGWALLHLLWQGVLVAGILAASLALLKQRGANARYLVSCAALALLIALPVATAWRAYETPLPATSSATVPSFAGLTESLTTSAVPQTAQQPSWTDRAQQFLRGAGAYLPQIVLLWLIGVAFLSLRLLYGWSEAQRLARDGASSASSEWQAALMRIADAMQLRRAVTLLESAKVEVPTVVGWLRPIVLLPAATLAGLSREQLEMVLAHELAHIRRHDFFVNLLQAVVETLLFYHPAVWWISRQVRIERENCCDDLAISVCGNPLQYARALARLEELRADPPVTALAANGGSLLVRVRRLVASRAESTNGPSRWAAGAALVTVLVALLALPSMPLFAKHETKSEPQVSPSPSPSTRTSSSSSSEARSEIDVHADSSPVEDDDNEVDLEDITIDVDEPTPPRAPRAPNAEAAEATASTPVAPAAPPAPPAPVAFPAPAPHPYPAIAIAPEIDLSGIVAPAVAQALSNLRVEVPRVAVAPAAPRVRTTRRSRTFGAGDKLTVDELIALRTAGITPEYINDMRNNAGLGELSLDDLYAMRIQGVSAEYIRSLRAAGVPVKSASEAVAMRIHGVSDEYAKQLADAGYRNLSPEDLIALRIHGVSASFIKSLADAGYTNLSATEIARLAASGVNAEFIRDLSQYRKKDKGKDK